MPLDAIDKYDVAGEASENILGKAKNFAVATSADFVSTLYNSTVGLVADDIRTEDILDRTDKDALAFYREHKEGVEAASFIAGVVTPGFAAVKLLNRAKAGMAAVQGSGLASDIFTGKKATQLQTELRKIFEDGGYGTTSYTSTMRKLYASKIGENFLDAALFEGITIGTLNAHPYMEDYMQSPFTQFAMWGGLGGAIGSVVSSIGVRAAVNASLGAVKKEGIETVFGAFTKSREEADIYKKFPDNLADTAATRYQKLSANVSNLESLVSAEASPNQVTRGLILNAIQDQRAARERVIAEAAPFLDKLPKTEQEAIRPLVEGILGDIRFAEGKKIGIPSLGSVSKDAKGALEFDKDTELSFKNAGGKNTVMFYRPASGDLYDRAGAKNAATAVDLRGYQLKNDVNLGTANNDFLIEAMSRLVPSAKIDAQHLNELATWDKVKPDNLKYITIAPNDLPRQNAAIRWLAKQSQKVQQDAQFFVKNEQASHREIEQFIEKGGAGVKPTYLKDLKSVVDHGEFGLMEQLGNHKGSGLLADWKSGDTSSLRHVFDAFFRGTRLPKELENQGALNSAQNIWDAGEKFRTAMRQMADADGNVYLYRGLRNAIKGHAPIEGYTIAPDIAANFGTVRLFKVNVDNILGQIGGRGYKGEREILVASPHNQIVNDLPVMTGESTRVVVPTSGQGKDVMTGEQLVQFYHDNVKNAVSEMTAGSNPFANVPIQGLANQKQALDVSFDEISAKLNLTKQAAIAIAAGTDPGVIPQAFRYTDASKISSEYLHPKNKMLSVAGNPYKTNMSGILANLDNRTSSVADRQIVQFFTEASDSDIAKSIMNIYAPLDKPADSKFMQSALQLLNQEIGDINNQLIGSPTFQTADNALRKIQSGGFLSYLGKENTRNQDKLIEKFLEPVAIQMSGLKKDTEIIEFNALQQRMLSLAGWKQVRTEAETGLGYIVQRENREDGKIVEVPVREKDGSTFYIRQPAVIAAWTSQKEVGSQLLSTANLIRKIKGQKPINDLGDYSPPPNLLGKSIAYVMDGSGLEKVKLLYGNSEEELRSLVASYKSEVIANSPQYRVVVGHGTDLEEYNLIKQYAEGEHYLTFANNELRHGGSSASAVVRPGAEGINDLIAGWENQIISSSRKYHRMYLDDIFQKLDFLSKTNQEFTQGQPLKGLAKSKSEDSAKFVANTILGKGSLEESTIWKTLDDGYSLMMQNAANTFSNTVKTFRGKEGTSEYFEKLSQDMQKIGMKNPWESYDLYSQASAVSHSPQVAKRIQSAGNGLIATLQLRLADASFALVNTMSLPVLLNASVMEGLPKTELPNGSKVTLPLRLMYDAMRMYFNPEGKTLIKEWTEKGLITSPTRQYVDIVGKIKSPVTTKDAADEVISAIEGFQKSKAVQLLSKPADFTESFTREFAMLTGYLAAKHAYPDISNIGATIHASGVADRAIGNYYSSQRPTIFQGALGSMLGLYQTYLMSFAQSVYRGIENKSFVQLAQTAGLQAGIFGTASWPGYNLLSETIGKYLSNQNYDLTTGTYRAVGDTTAQLVLYGLPSWLGPSFYTRGDITPRVPTFDNLAIVNTLTSSYNSMGKIVSGLMSQPGVEGKLQSMGEALSLQSLNRPLARVAEIATGESITSKGQTVSTNTEVWTPMGVMSRLLAVRPLEEQVTRNALHLNSYYGAVDYENRQRIVNKLRTAIRANDIPDDLIDKTASEYLLKGGSAKGWTDVMNQVMIKTEQGTRMDLMRKLQPDSPLRRMITETF